MVLGKYDVSENCPKRSDIAWSVFACEFSNVGKEGKDTHLRLVFRSYEIALDPEWKKTGSGEYYSFKILCYAR